MYLDGMPCLEIDAQRKKLSFDLSREKEIIEFYDRYSSGDVEYFAMNPDYGKSFYTFVDMLGSSKPESLKLVHTQMPGVLTWGLSLRDRFTEKPAWYDGTMRDILIKTLIMKGKWQEKRIKEAMPDIETMVTLGEPSLGVMGSAFGSVREDEVIAAIGEIFGEVEGFGCVHCCSNMDWSLLMKGSVKVINFDAYLFSEQMALYAEQIDEFMRNGGMLAWGIVPVTEEGIMSESEGSLFEKIEQAMELLGSAGVSRESVVERSFITPACVTSRLSTELAERAFSITRRVSQNIRKKYLDESETEI
jgi:hypothetical protein